MDCARVNPKFLRAGKLKLIYVTNVSKGTCNIFLKKSFQNNYQIFIFKLQLETLRFFISASVNSYDK